MANIKVSGSKFTIGSADTFILGGGSHSHGNVASWAIHLVSSSFSGSITVSARSAHPDASDIAANMGVAGDNIAFVAVPYQKNYLNGLVADGTLVSTAITGTSVIVVPASGVQIALNCTSFVSGSMAVYAVPLEGAAA